MDRSGDILYIRTSHEMYTSTEFGVDRICTRAQIVTFLYRTFAI